MGCKAGAFVKADKLAEAISTHYPGVHWDVEFAKTTGDTCRVNLNKAQAVAGQTFDRSKGARLDNDAYTAIAASADKIADKEYPKQKPSGEVVEKPAKMSKSKFESA